MKIQLKGNTVGCISLKDGLVDITDPCYNKDVWCRMNGVKVFPGEWLCTAFSGKDKDFGKRVWVCQIFSSDPKHVRLRSLANMNRDGWKEIGTIGVDAGLAGFFASKPDFNGTEWAGKKEEETENIAMIAAYIDYLMNLEENKTSSSDNRLISRWREFGLQKGVLRI